MLYSVQANDAQLSTMVAEQASLSLIYDIEFDVNATFRCYWLIFFWIKFIFKS